MGRAGTCYMATSSMSSDADTPACTAKLQLTGSGTKACSNHATKGPSFKVSCGSPIHQRTWNEARVQCHFDSLQSMRFELHMIATHQGASLHPMRSATHEYCCQNQVRFSPSAGNFQKSRDDFRTQQRSGHACCRGCRPCSPSPLWQMPMSAPAAHITQPRPHSCAHWWSN